MIGGGTIQGSTGPGIMGRLFRRLCLFWLTWQEAATQDEIAHGRALLASHRAMQMRAHGRLRRIHARLAMLETPQDVARRHRRKARFTA